MLSPAFSLLLSGVALVAIVAKVVTMQSSIQRAADARRLQQAEQSNASATVLLKALMSNGASGPEIYPDPSIRNDASLPFVFAGEMTSSTSNGGVWGLDLTSGTWGILAGSPLTPASRFQTLQVRTIDPSRVDPTTFFSGTGVTTSHTSVLAELVKFETASPGGLGEVKAAEFLLTTNFISSTSNKTRPVAFRVRIEVPPPPPPSCEISVAGGKAQLLVDGVALAGKIETRTIPADLIGSVEPPQISPATSVFGQRQVMLEVTTSEPGSNLRGSVDGPGGHAICKDDEEPPASSIRCIKTAYEVIKLNRVSLTEKKFALEFNFDTLHEKFPMWRSLEVSADGAIGMNSTVSVGPYAYSNQATSDYDDSYMRITSFGNFNAGKKSRIFKMRSWPKPIDIVEVEKIEPLRGVVKIAAQLHHNMPVKHTPLVKIVYCSKWQ